jgi:hypothetical protein
MTSVTLAAFPQESPLAVWGLLRARGVLGGVWQMGFERSDLGRAARLITGQQLVSEITEYGCSGAHGRHAPLVQAANRDLQRPLVLLIEL